MSSIQHKRYFFGLIVSDIYDNLDELLIPDYRYSNGRPLIIRRDRDYADLDMMRWFLKIFDTSYPKKENGEPYSLREVTDKQLVDHTEYIRLVAAENCYSLKIDDEEWERIKEMAR